MTQSSGEYRLLEAERDGLESVIRLLHRVAKLVRTSLELDPTIYAILTATTAGEGLGMNRAMLFLREGDSLRGVGAVGPRDRVEADRVWRSIEAEAPDLSELYAAGLRQIERRDDTTLDGKIRDLRVDLTRPSPIGLALEAGKVIVGEGRDDLDGLLHLPTGVATPLPGRSEPIGVLFADNKFTSRALDPTKLLVFDLLADHAAHAIQAARLYEGVAHRARIDALTGLPHHGSLMDGLQDAVRGAASSGQALGLIMIDVDDFKRVNDTYGHPVGDALLSHFAARIKGAVRNPEHVYRYGGEELTVLLPGANTQATASIAERIRVTIGGRPFAIDDGPLLSITCSLGVASYPGHAGTPEALIQAADNALLSAKREGKNRVVVA